MQRSCGGDVVARQAAVLKYAQSAHLLAHVNAALPARVTGAARNIRVHDYAVTRAQTFGIGAAFEHAGDILVPQNAPGGSRMLRRIGENMQVRAANAGTLHFEQHVIGLGPPRLCHLL